MIRTGRPFSNAGWEAETKFEPLFALLQSKLSRGVSRRRSQRCKPPHDQHRDCAEACPGHVGDEIAHPAMVNPGRALGDLDEESQREARQE